MNKKIAIIGAGNMGQAIAQGLLSKKVLTKDRLFLTDSKTRNNKEAVQKADVIILAVKPNVMQQVLGEIKNMLDNQLVISIAAGVTLASLEQNLGNKKHIVRVMTNLGAKIGYAMSGWIGNASITKTDKNIVRKILCAIGKEIEVKKEEEIDMITALSGSGIAYFFYLAELLEEAGRVFGFSEEVSSLLAVQTLIGSAKVVENSTLSVNQLRAAVTSKGGTTEAAFTKFEKDNLGKLFKEGVIAAYNRAKQLKIS